MGDAANVYISNNWVSYVSVGLLILGFVLWLRHAMKKHPDLNAGEIINLVLLKDFVTIFMLALGGLSLGEAIYAASIQVKGEVSTNPLARVFGHFVLQMIAIVFTILTPLLFMVATKVKEKRKRRYFAATLCLIGALGLPYLNLYFIASGLKQMELLDYFVMSLNPINHISLFGGGMCDYYDSLVGYSQYPDMGCGFSPLQHMEYPMLVCVGVFFTHLFISFVDAWMMISFPLTDMSKVIMSKFGIDIADSKDKKKSESGKEDTESKGTIAFLLRRLYGKNPTVVSLDGPDGLIKKYEDKHSTMNESSRSTLSNKLADLMMEIKEFDKTTRSGLKGSALDSALASQNKKIKELWSRSVDKGQGFGETLKDPK